ADVRTIETEWGTVFDAERGRPGPFHGLSAGAQVLVGEALKLGICIFNGRRHGATIETLYRDEADAHLSDELATLYPTMLRRALAIGGFHRAYFISHRPAVWAQADARIEVGGGTARIVG
ncbi:MAG: hypothetical protein AAB262_00060, partial [Elusimicrobiota bacterium]